MNKVDVTRLEELTPESRAIVQEIIDSEGVHSLQVSCYSEEGVMELKNKACEILLAHRVENKLRGSKINAIANRIHVAQPKPRDEVVRAPFIPDAVKEKMKFDKEDQERRRLLRDEEEAEGGAGVFSINMKSVLFDIYAFSLALTWFFHLQGIIFSLILNGRWTLCLKLWMARISLISLTLILRRNLRHLNARRKNSRLKAFMKVTRI